MKIFKYPLNEIIDKGSVYLDLPQGYKVLDVQMQNEVPTLWAAVDTDNPIAKVMVEIKPTGGDVDLNDLQFYFKTIQSLGGVFIWHVFVRPV